MNTAAERNPQEFRTAEHAWHLSLPIGLARKIKTAYAVDLPGAWRNEWAGLSALLADCWLFLDVLWAMVEETAAARTIDRPTFESAMDEAATEQAAEALRETITGFIPRSERAQIIGAARLTEIAMKAAAAKADDPQTAADIVAAVGAEIDRRLRVARTTGESSRP